jgi:hypothetical protein
MSQVAKSASAFVRAFLAILVLELEDMVVRLFRPPKLASVRGDRWTVRWASRLTSGVSLGAWLGAQGFALVAEAAKRALDGFAEGTHEWSQLNSYPSARHANGVCLAAFLQCLIQPFQWGESWILKWPEAQRRRS